MKLSRVVVLSVALGAGAIAAVLALRLSSLPQPEQIAEQQPVQTEAVHVLVATKDIPMGKTLSSDSIGWQDWPRTGVSDKFVVQSTNPDGIKSMDGAIARASIYQGEPITEAKLIRSDRGFMSAILPEGMRAVATKISADTSAGGFILPNDRVDVVMTRHNEDPNAAPDAKYLTETILHNVRVLAIDQTIEDQNGERVVVGQTATLELSPQQVEILTVAQQVGERLNLALRSIEDATPSPSDSSHDAVHLVGGTKRNGAVTVVKSGVAREVSGIR
jgi:pilus assembly protein CpaB